MKTKEKGFLILPYLPFPTLQTFLEEKGPLSEADAIYVLAQMIDTINLLKNHGVAHRDVKADNIIINPDTLVIKFIDFGLGKAIVDEFTPSDQFIGTPIYMSPEILKRESAFWVVVADLWSVGVVFLEMLMGVHPFFGASSERHLLRMHSKFSYSQFSSKVQGLLDVLLADSPCERIDAFDFVSRGIITADNSLTSVSPANSPQVRRKRHSLARTKTNDESSTNVFDLKKNSPPAAYARCGSISRLV
eukprot:TRINITY_DN12240_c0_g1_i1.p1 TRINITY_DN12240_c0_g1~~TRINITY_DN12240_c0_g1_i1.p1  ORF type:complete len:247 (-),score=71.59 TRINITY_DN12240_c0_g1_i1:143-883(-)